MTNATLSDQTEFRLLRYFASASLIFFVLVAFLLGYIFRTMIVDGIVKGYEAEHVNHAQLLANEMWDDSFGPLALAVVGKSAAQARALPQIPEIHQKVLMLLKGSKIFKIKVYDLKGVTIYSTEPMQIGEDKSTNGGVINALRGLSSSELVHGNLISAFEGELQDRDLVETYVPRLDPASHKALGVFEIYGDATSVLQEIGLRQRYVIFAVVAMLAMLYFALFIIVRRAQNFIFRQNQQRKEAQQALIASEERWKFALEGSGDGVWDRNLQTGEVVVSKRYAEIYGYSEDDLVSQKETWDQRVHPDDLARIEADREAYLTGDKESYANERRMQCKDGSWKWILSRGMVVARDARGRPLRMIGTHTDISERKALDESLQHLAHFDVLTGLPNRALFSDRLRVSLANARRSTARMALIFIDLDEFKPVNDLFGHQVGDLLLQGAAQRLLACVRRESDTVARLGGDEFIVMLSEIEKLQDVLTVANNILQALNQAFQIGSDIVHISCSMGIAIYPEHGKDKNGLLKAADAAMYRAKELGRNRVEVAQDLENPVS